MQFDRRIGQMGGLRKGNRETKLNQRLARKKRHQRQTKYWDGMWNLSDSFGDLYMYVCKIDVIYSHRHRI